MWPLDFVDFLDERSLETTRPTPSRDPNFIQVLLFGQKLDVFWIFEKWWFFKELGNFYPRKLWKIFSHFDVLILFQLGGFANPPRSRKVPNFVPNAWARRWRKWQRLQLLSFDFSLKWIGGKFGLHKKTAPNLKGQISNLSYIPKGLFLFQGPFFLFFFVRHLSNVESQFELGGLEEPRQHPPPLSFNWNKWLAS